MSLRSRASNMRSATDHPDVVDEYLRTELAAGRLAGPFIAPPLRSLHVSPFGVIPKNHQSGKWRLILDPSSPLGHSVNDGIPNDPYSLKYVTVDDAIRSLVDLGPGALIAKFDVKAAYRNIPSTLTTVSSWVRNGAIGSTWILFYLLVCVRLHLSSILLRKLMSGF